MTAPSNDSLDRLRRDLGFKPLSLWWAKFEIVLGLTTMGAGVIGAVNLGVEVIQLTRQKGDVFGLPLPAAVGPLLLFVLGGYLALAGHRSHLYQSNNRIAAYLADLIRSRPAAPPDRPQRPET
jgi:hypothetical protein